MAKNSDSHSLARSISGTGNFLRTQAWVWPIIAAVILAVAGFWIRSVVEISVKDTMAKNLQTILAADVAALELWYESQVANVDAVASDRDVRSFVERLTTMAAEEDVDTALLAQSPHQKAIQVELESWIEAHGVGLIHRDIKPANMIANVRGGVYDFVKLLDFGLVKALDSKKQAALTATGSFTGTPLYVSPEGIKTPDKTLIDNSQ